MRTKTPRRRSAGLDTEAIGVIGLGAMGAPMAANLVRRGFRVIGFDISTSALAACRRQGVIPKKSVAEVCTGADILVLSLPTQHVLREVMLAPGGMIEVISAGKLIIDTTTTTVCLAQELHAAAARKHAEYLDAPVTGGTVGAQEGTLSIMVGGDDPAFARARPVLDAIGGNVVHIGPSGHGQVAKMVNQMLMAAIYTSVAEAFAFAAQFGVNVERVFHAVESGGGRSKQLSAIGPSLIAGTLHGNGNLAQHGKDIDYVIDDATRRKIFLPITSAVHEFYNLSRSLGFGPNSSRDMWAVWEKILGISHVATLRKNSTCVVGAGSA